MELDFESVSFSNDSAEPQSPDHDKARPVSSPVPDLGGEGMHIALLSSSLAAQQGLVPMSASAEHDFLSRITAVSSNPTLSSSPSSSAPLPSSVSSPNPSKPSEPSSTITVFGYDPTTPITTVIQTIQDHCGPTAGHELAAGNKLLIHFETPELADKAIEKLSSNIEIAGQKLHALKINHTSAGGNQTLVLKNLPFSLKHDKLIDSLNKLEVKPLYARYHHDASGSFRGIAYVKYKTSDEAQAAFHLLDGSEVMGRKVRAEYKRKGTGSGTPKSQPGSLSSSLSDSSFIERANGLPSSGLAFSLQQQLSASSPSPISASPSGSVSVLGRASLSVNVPAVGSNSAFSPLVIRKEPLMSSPDSASSSSSTPLSPSPGSALFSSSPSSSSPFSPPPSKGGPLGKPPLSAEKASKKAAAAAAAEKESSNTPSQPQPPHNQEEVKEVETKLKEFKENAEAVEITFPSSQTQQQRRMVHAIAERLGLVHFSRGEGEQRYLTIRKVSDLSPASGRESPSHPPASNRERSNSNSAPSLSSSWNGNSGSWGQQPQHSHLHNHFHHFNKHGSSSSSPSSSSSLLPAPLPPSSGPILSSSPSSSSPSFHLSSSPPASFSSSSSPRISGPSGRRLSSSGLSSSPGSSSSLHSALFKQPKGPEEGSKGFGAGRGKPVTSKSASCS